MNAGSGFAFAWYIPQAAATARYDPLARASEERAGAIETAARARLGNADASAWLDRPHPALGNSSPRAAAAADVEGFEHALGLLQGPRAVAA
jgi:hypothetical protein